MHNYSLGTLGWCWHIYQCLYMFVMFWCCKPQAKKTSPYQALPDSEGRCRLNSSRGVLQFPLMISLSELNLPGWSLWSIYYNMILWKCQNKMSLKHLLRHIKAQASYHRDIPLTNFVHLPALQKDQLHQHSKAHSCLSVSNSFSHSSSLPSNPRHSMAFCGHFSECQFHWKQPVM